MHPQLVRGRELGGEGITKPREDGSCRDPPMIVPIFLGREGGVKAMGPWLAACVHQAYPTHTKLTGIWEDGSDAEALLDNRYSCWVSDLAHHGLQWILFLSTPFKVPTKFLTSSRHAASPSPPSHPHVYVHPQAWIKACGHILPSACLCACPLLSLAVTLVLAPDHTLVPARIAFLPFQQYLMSIGENAVAHSCPLMSQLAVLALPPHRQ